MSQGKIRDEDFIVKEETERERPAGEQKESFKDDNVLCIFSWKSFHP